mgnify:CR=1 FL=1|tara:strand:- start:7533 stop:8000 length:468 start_codon:yes stop_codon:yes gene_type:complete
MNSSYIFWPVLAQVLLTLIVFVVLGVRKAKAVKAGEVNRKAAALNNREWPEDVVKVSNNIANQFEFPVLFYVLCLVLHNINAVGMAALVLAWLFALSRFAHAYVHIGSNYVPMRMRLFLVGCLILIGMLILVASELATHIVGVLPVPEFRTNFSC